jgi:hypothetical protein
VSTAYDLNAASSEAIGLVRSMREGQTDMQIALELSDLIASFPEALTESIGSGEFEPQSSPFEKAILNLTITIGGLLELELGGVTPAPVDLDAIESWGSYLLSLIEPYQDADDLSVIPEDEMVVIRHITLKLIRLGLAFL